jgi:hypothetical protein
LLADGSLQYIDDSLLFERAEGWRERIGADTGRNHD